MWLNIALLKKLLTIHTESLMLRKIGISCIATTKMKYNKEILYLVWFDAVV